MNKGLSEFMYGQLDELEELFKKKHEQYSSGADELDSVRAVRDKKEDIAK